MKHINRGAVDILLSGFHQCQGGYCWVIGVIDVNPRKKRIIYCITRTNKDRDRHGRGHLEGRLCNISTRKEGQPKVCSWISVVGGNPN